MREGERPAGPGLFDAWFDPPPARPASKVLPPLPPIEFVTCLSCGSTNDIMFFDHTADGSARPLVTEAKLPRFSSARIAETWVGLSPAAPRWAWQCIFNRFQNFFRVGGAPTWVQNAAYPDCPDCGRAMPFVLQLPSGLRVADGSELLWGDAGTSYASSCATCRVSAVRWQCY